MKSTEIQFNTTSCAWENLGDPNDLQSYYYDTDGDGAGYGYAGQYCFDDLAVQSGGWVTNNDDLCPNHAYTQPDNCGKCGGNNIHNFVDQHTQELCFPSPSTWNSNGVSHSIAPYPYDENTKMYSHEIGGCTHKVELSIGWIVPDTYYN